MSDRFESGRELSQRLYAELVGPQLTIPQTAALLGAGSDVLGFDDETSRDHGWGPRVQIFLPDGIEPTSLELPEVFSGYVLSGCRPMFEPVEFTTLAAFEAKVLGPLVPSAEHPLHWLLVTQHELRSLTAPNIWHDALGLADHFASYGQFPPDIRRYLLASLWSRIGEEEHLVGRAGMVGDELGAAVIAGRLVRDLMRISFLLEGVCAPYPKWLGTAFRELEISDRLNTILEAAATAPDWRSRDTRLAEAYGVVAGEYNALAITPEVQLRVGMFHERPIQVIVHDSGVVEALLARISDPRLACLKGRRPIGSLETLCDSTDLLEDRARRARLLALFTPG